jgi:hypothetical protein
MAEIYTIESAADDVPIDPKLLRELRDLLREDDDLDVGVRLKDRPPAPGEQGAVAVALEVVAAAGPVSTALAYVLTHWIDACKVPRPIKVRKGGMDIEIGSGNVQEAVRLMTKLEWGSDAEPRDGG